MAESATSTADQPEKSDESGKDKTEQKAAKIPDDLLPPGMRKLPPPPKDAFEDSEKTLELIKATTEPLDVPKLLDQLQKAFPVDDFTADQLGEAPDPEWMRIDRNVFKWMLYQRDEYYLLRYKHMYCETPEERKKTEKFFESFRREKEMRKMILMFARARVPVSLEEYENNRQKYKLPWLDKDREHCPTYWKKRAYAHTIRGPIWIDSTSSSKLGKPEYDPWAYIDTFMKGLDEYNDLGYLLVQKEIKRTPKRFALTEIHNHQKNEGCWWVMCIPWVLEIPLDGDTAYFNLTNISPRKLTFKIKITGTDNFTIRPGLKTMEPFSTKALALKYKRKKAMKEPYEFMKVYYIDTIAFEKAKKKFPKKHVEISTHFNGKLIVPVVVHNYKNVHKIEHNPSVGRDARRTRRARALVAHWKKELEGVAGTRKLPERYNYGIDITVATDSSDSEELWKKEIALTDAEIKEQRKMDEKKAERFAKEHARRLYSEPAEKQTIKATEGDEQGNTTTNVSSDIPVVPNTVSRDLPRNTTSRAGGPVSKEGAKRGKTVAKRAKSDAKRKPKQRESASSVASDEKFRKPKASTMSKVKKSTKQKESSSAAASDERIVKKPPKQKESVSSVASDERFQKPKPKASASGESKVKKPAKKNPKQKSKDKRKAGKKDKKKAPSKSTVSGNDL